MQFELVVEAITMNPIIAHCNKCYVVPSSGTRSKYFLTSCGNVYCQKCLSQGVCKCGKNCSSRPISNPSVINFFQDNAPKVSSLLKSLNFQSKRYNIFYKYTEARYKSMTRALKERDIKIQTLESQIAERLNAIDQMKQELKQQKELAQTQKQRQQQNFSFQDDNLMELSFATTAVNNAISSDNSHSRLF